MSGEALASSMGGIANTDCFATSLVTSDPIGSSVAAELTAAAVTMAYSR